MERSERVNRQRLRLAAGRILPCPLVALLGLAGSAATAAPRAVLVLRPELTADAVFRPGSPFARLLPRAAIGVLNTAVRGSRQPASAYLTLGAGERVAAGPLTGPARFLDGPIADASRPAVTAGRPPHLSSGALILPGWAAFRNSSDPDYPLGGPRAAGGLGQALRGRGEAGWLGVEEAARTRLGALTALDAAGTVPQAGTLDLTRLQSRHGPSSLSNLTHPPWSHVRLVVLDLPPNFDTRRLAALLDALTRDRDRDVLLVSPYPPPGIRGAWDRLPPRSGLRARFPARSPDLRRHPYRGSHREHRRRAVAARRAGCFHPRNDERARDEGGKGE